MCHVSPYNVPTAQGSPLPSPQPSWAECMASAREGMAFREQDEGLAVPIPAHSKAQTPPTPRPAVVATPQRPPHALLCYWCFSLLGHKHRTEGHGQARQPPALTVAPSAPCSRVGFALPLAPTVQHPLDPGFPLCGAGNGSELRSASDPGCGAQHFQQYPLFLHTGSSTGRANSWRGLTEPGVVHPWKRGGWYTGTRQTPMALPQSHTAAVAPGSAQITAQPHMEQSPCTATGQSAPTGACTCA